MSVVLTEYVAAVVKSLASRNATLPILAFLLGGGGAATLWRSATKPITVEGEP